MRVRKASMRQVRQDVGVREARARFGGLDVPASLIGMLTALGLLVLLGGLIGAAIGAVVYQVGLEGNEQDLSLASLMGGLGVLFVAFLIGGWAAGRVARYNGVRNGLLAGLWTIVLAAALGALGAGLGSKYDILRSVNLPDWFSRDALTVTGVVSSIATVAAMLVGGALGGLWGERYHRRADALIANTREGGIAARED